MSRLRKTITALSLIAVGVVVRCGDIDDDDEKERREQARSTAAIIASSNEVQTPSLPLALTSRDDASYLATI